MVLVYSVKKYAAARSYKYRNKKCLAKVIKIDRTIIPPTTKSALSSAHPAPPPQTRIPLKVYNNPDHQPNTQRQKKERTHQSCGQGRTYNAQGATVPPRKDNV